jgi:hypothetical protein
MQAMYSHGKIQQVDPDEQKRPSVVPKKSVRKFMYTTASKLATILGFRQPEKPNNYPVV